MDMCWSKFIELDRDRIVYYERDTKFKDRWKELLQQRKEEFGEMAKISLVYKKRLKEVYEKFEEWLQEFQALGLYVVNIGGHDYSFYTLED